MTEPLSTVDNPVDVGVELAMMRAAVDLASACTGALRQVQLELAESVADPGPRKQARHLVVAADWLRETEKNLSNMHILGPSGIASATNPTDMWTLVVALRLLGRQVADAGVALVTARTFAELAFPTEPDRLTISVEALIAQIADLEQRRSAAWRLALVSASQPAVDQ